MRKEEPVATNPHVNHDDERCSDLSQACASCLTGFEAWKSARGITKADEYDSVSCITAQELRKMGVAIPGDVPDCGWVPRCAVSYGLADQGKVEDSKITCSLTIRILAPFRWFEVRGEVETGQRNECVTPPWP